jgi:phage/plasmid-associated DNA primase
MEEITNIQLVNGFISNKMGIDIQDSRWTSRYKTELNQMEEYKKIYNAKSKSFATGFSLPKHKWGRIIPFNYLSLSIMRRKTRHSLCDGVYIDIDMVNCQPTALFAIASQNDDFPMPKLKLYIDDPKSFRAQIAEHHGCDKDTAKELPILLMMGGSYDGWFKLNDIQTNREDNQKIKFMKDLEDELKTAINYVYCHNKHIQKDVLRQDPKKWSTENECKRGVMGLWSQTVERIFQECAIAYLVETRGLKLEYIVPSQDGFMILKEFYYDGIIDDCNNAVSSTYGINMKFIVKPFDEKIEIPLYAGGKTFFEWNDLISAAKLSERLLHDYGDYILKYKQKLFIYYENRWYEETNSKNQHHLTRYISKHLYESLFNDISADISLDELPKCKLLTTLRDHTSNTSRINDIVKQTMAFAKERKEDFNQHIFLLGFDNGVFDLNENMFRDYRYDDYMTMSVNYNYEKPNYDDENVMQQREELIRLIESIHPDVEYRTIYMQILASGLDGRQYQKLFMFNGEGGNGKGTTSKLMKTILGDYYHQPSNGILNDIEKANTVSPDIMNLKNKRYLDFAEVGDTLNATIVNKLTGGDSFNGRYLRENPEEFNLHSTQVINFNQAPDFGKTLGASEIRRLIDIFFSTNCVQNDDSRIGTTVNGITYIEANRKYETDAFFKSVRPIFLDILLGAYQEFRDKENGTGIIFTLTEKICKRNAEFVSNQDIFKKIFEEFFVKAPIDTQQDTELKLKDIWRHITAASEIYKNLSYREKRRYGRDEFYKWIGKLAKIDHTREKTISGYMYIVDS